MPLFSGNEGDFGLVTVSPLIMAAVFPTGSSPAAYPSADGIKLNLLLSGEVDGEVDTVSVPLVVGLFVSSGDIRFGDVADVLVSSGHTSS